MANGIRQTNSGAVITSSGVAQTVASSATWVDNFNDQNLTEYSGATGSYNFDTSSPIEGTASLHRQADSNGYQVISSSSGLDNYISKPQKFQYKVEGGASNGDSESCQMGAIFGYVDSNNYYSIRYEFSDDDFFILERSGGSNSAVAANNSAIGGTYSSGTVLIIEVTWDDGNTFGGSDGDITATLYSADKNTTHATISGNSTANNGTNVGVRSWAGSSNDSWIDAYEILG